MLLTRNVEKARGDKEGAEVRLESILPMEVVNGKYMLS